MIILKEAIFPPRKFGPIQVHNDNPELGITARNMILYYWVIFMNRTTRDAPYISRFTSVH